MANIISSDQIAGRIYVHSGFSNVIIDSFASANQPRGLGFDGTNLIHVQQIQFGIDLAVRYAGITDTITDTFGGQSLEAGGLEIQDITWDGTNYLVCASVSNKVFKISGFTATVLDSFTASESLLGVTWDGTNVVTIFNNSGRIVRHSGFSATILDSFATPGTFALGMSWDGTNIISVDSIIARIYKHSGFSSTILDSFSTPASQPRGVTVAVVADIFTVTLQYKNAGASFVDVTSSLGDTGASIGIGSRTAYWDNPDADRPGVEVTDEQVKINAVPDGGNAETYILNVASASQLSAGDGTGAQGDVKVDYTIT